MWGSLVIHAPAGQTGLRRRGGRSGVQGEGLLAKGQWQRSQQRVRGENEAEGRRKGRGGGEVGAREGPPRWTGRVASGRVW